MKARAPFVPVLSTGTLFPIVFPAMENRRWLDAEVALHSVGAKVFDEGLASLSAILDRLAAIKQQDKTSNIRIALLEREKEIRGVASEYGVFVRSLGNLSDADRWDDAVVCCYQKLARAYSELLDDLHQAMRLIVQVWDSAHDPQLRQSLEQERKNFYRTIHCREAEALLQAGDFTGAEFKLVGALANSTYEEKAEILAMQDRCRWARVLDDIDTSQTTPLLRAVLGSGTVLRGRYNEDYATRSYIARHWLTLFYFPVFPLGAYRVSETETGAQRIHGRTTLTGPLGKARWAILLVCVALLASLPGTIHWKKAAALAPSSPASPAAPLPNVAPTAPLPAAPAQPLAAQHDQARRIPKGELEQDSVRASLDREKVALDAEAADLTQRKMYYMKAGVVHGNGSMPESGQRTREEVSSRYASDFVKYQNKLAGWKRRKAAYESHAESQPSNRN